MKNLFLALILCMGISISAQTRNNNTRQRAERTVEVTNNTDQTISYLYIVEDMAKVEIADDGSLTAEAEDALGENVLEIGATHTFRTRSQTCSMSFVGQSDKPAVFLLEDIDTCTINEIEFTASECVANCEDGAEDEPVDEDMVPDTGSFSVQNNTGVTLTHIFITDDIATLSFGGGQVDPTSGDDLLGEDILDADAEISLVHNSNSCEVHLFANGEDGNVYYVQNANICDGDAIEISKENMYDYPGEMEEEETGDEETFVGAGTYTVKNLTSKQISFLYAVPEGGDTEDTEGLEDFLGELLLNPRQTLELTLKFPSETTQFVAVFEDRTRMVVELTICDGCPEELIFRTVRRN